MAEENVLSFDKTDVGDLIDYMHGFEDDCSDLENTNIDGVVANLKKWQKNKAQLYKDLCKMLGEPVKRYRWAIPMELQQQLCLNDKCDLVYNFMGKLSDLIKLENTGTNNTIFGNSFLYANVNNMMSKITSCNSYYNKLNKDNKYYKEEVNKQLNELNTFFKTKIAINNKDKNVFNQSDLGNETTLIKKMLNGIIKDYNILTICALHKKDVSDKLSTTLDALNVNKKNYTCWISVDPIDYISCSQGNSWESCHAPNGCYCAGSWSYMIDKSTFITYVEAENSRYDLPVGRDRIYRMLCHMNYDCSILITARLYPAKNDSDLPEQYSKVIAKALLKDKYTDSVGDYNDIAMISRSNGLNYKDYTLSGFNAKLYLFNDLTPVEYKKQLLKSNKSIEIGERPWCLSCGVEYMQGNDNDDRAQLYCDDCYSGYTYHCEDCGCGLSEDNSYNTYYDTIVCEDCRDRYYTFCDDVEAYVKNDDATYCESDGCYYYSTDDLYYVESKDAYYLIDDVVELNNGDWGCVNDSVELYYGGYCLADDSVELYNGDFAEKNDDNLITLYNGDMALSTDTDIVILYNGDFAPDYDIVVDINGNNILANQSVCIGNNGFILKSEAYQDNAETMSYMVSPTSDIYRQSLETIDNQNGNQ